MTRATVVVLVLMALAVGCGAAWSDSAGDVHTADYPCGSRNHCCAVGGGWCLIGWACCGDPGTLACAGAPGMCERLPDYVGAARSADGGTVPASVPRGTR